MNNPLPSISEELGKLLANRYRIEQVLGRGGMGAVYRARDERSDGRIVAVKRLRVAHSNPKRAVITAMFELEFHTLVELAHPQIIEVYDYGVDDAGAYYTMELLDGQDLGERGTLPWKDACALLRDVASSLAILHARRLLHRDVSPRNVRCTSDGRAKLIDFGAMAPMGKSTNLVGTPPFVAPECLQLQELDGRVDLFALGGLAYFMVTGRIAYPARTIAQLRDVWRSAPVPPSRIAPDVPPALSQLILELLELERSARPSSAAVVMERLCAIAGLPFVEHIDVAQAYLLTPTLVGRDALLASVRERLLQMIAGTGSTLLLSGASGSGRTRLLDACILEAKMLGAVVLRAAVGDVASSEFGYAVVRTLSTQLCEHDPALAKRLARRNLALLQTVIAPLRDDDDAPLVAADRQQLAAALKDFWLAMTRRIRVVIALDDIESVDEASGALLAELAHRAPRRSLSLILTVDGSADPTPALAMIAAEAETLAIEPLSVTEVETLTRSVFGDATSVMTVAERVHEVSAGLPRDVMALLDHLVRRGVVRHEAGGWVLPTQLEAKDLPDSVFSSLRARLADLEPDALDLATVLALTDPMLFSIDQYAALAGYEGHARVFRAIEALLNAGVLRAADDRYRFAQRAWPAILDELLAPEHRRTLHARLAGLAENSSDPARYPYHLLEAGMAERAIDLLLAGRDRAGYEASVAQLRLVQRAWTQAELLGLPVAICIQLQAWLVTMAAVTGDHVVFQAHAPPALERLLRDSGLTDWYGLDASLPAQDRVVQALTRAQERYVAASERDRGLPPVEAIRQLARLYSAYSGMAGVTQELTLVEALPSLEPFFGLSPALWVVQQAVIGVCRFQEGRFLAARDAFLQLLDRLQQPVAGLDSPRQETIRLSIIYIIALIEAGRGQLSADSRTPELAASPNHRVNGARVNMAVALMRGDIAAAREFERRAELLLLQDGGRQLFPATSLRLEILAHILSDDLMGVKQCLDRFVPIAERLPRWGTIRDTARSHYKRLQGDHQGALDALTEALATAEPGRVLDWSWIADAHIAALTALGRNAEAAQLGLEYLALCKLKKLAPSERNMMPHVVEALLADGRVEQALQLTESGIVQTEADGITGMRLGIFCETRARVAIAQGDEAGFQRWTARCAEEYKLGRNPALSARYARLLQEAERHRLHGSEELQRADEWTGVGSDGQARTVQETLLSRFAECGDREERARCALTILIEHTGADAGCIYGLSDGALSVLSTVGEPRIDAGLVLWLEQHIQLAMASAQPVVRAAELETMVEAGLLREGTAHPVMILSRRAGEVDFVAAAALYAGSAWSAPSSELIQQLADSLLAHDDLETA